MRLLRFRVRTRIYVGFGVLVAISTAIAAFGALQFPGIKADVERMNLLTLNATRALRTAAALDAVVLAERRYLTDPSASALRQATDSADRANALLARIIADAASPRRRAAFAQVQRELQIYRADLENFGTTGKTAGEQQARLVGGGKTVTQAMTRLVAAARATQNPALAGAATDLAATILRLRIDSLRFEAAPDTIHLRAFAAGVRRVTAAIAALQPLASPDIAGLVPPVQAALAAYEATFRAFSAARLHAQELYTRRLRPRLRAMRTQLDAVVARQETLSVQRRTAADAAIAAAASMQQAAALLALLIGATLAFLLGRGIVRPLTAMTGVMARLAAGDLGIAIPARDSQDEIGDMARAVEVFKQHAIAAEQLTAQQAAERAAKERRQAAMEQHTRDFGDSVSGVMASLAAAADTMRRAADTMAEATAEVHTEAHATAGGAAKSSRDLTTVAAAVEQLTASVAEISRQVAQAATVARQAVQRAAVSRGTMQELAESTARIGDIVRLINDIAGQTNLLALNATIEAARAGDAGKGFAVVAGEVKTLAAQTARATADIGSQIDMVRTAAAEAVTAMTEIGGIIGQMDAVSAAISAAVEQQNATTRDIGANVQAVAEATGGTAQAMDHVVSVAGKAGDISRDVLTGAADIGREAQTLRAEVDQFLAAVRDERVEERRRYDRVPVRGLAVEVRATGRDHTPMPLRNISRGGAAMACDWVLAAGTRLDLALPDEGGLVPARVARCGGGELAVVFQASADSLPRIDRLLARLNDTRRAA